MFNWHYTATFLEGGTLHGSVRAFSEQRLQRKVHAELLQRTGFSSLPEYQVDAERINDPVLKWLPMVLAMVFAVTRSILRLTSMGAP